MGGALSGSAAGSLAFSGGGSAPATPPLDAFTTVPRAAWGTERLLSSYSGDLYTVRKTTGGDTVSTHDVPYDPATNADDTASLVGFVGSESWVHTRWFDQVSARHLTQAVAITQPRGGAAGAADVVGPQRAAKFDGSNDDLARADALGLSGAVSLTVHVRFAHDGSFPFVQVPLSLGALAAGQVLNLQIPNATTVGVGISGANRLFSCSALGTGAHSLLVVYTGGSGIGTARCWLDGVELSELSSSNPSNTLNLGTTATALANNPGGSNFTNIRLSRAVVWNAALTGAELTAAAAL